MFCDSVEVEVNDIDPESGTGTCIDQCQCWGDPRRGAGRGEPMRRQWKGLADHQNDEFD